MTEQRAIGRDGARVAIGATPFETGFWRTVWTCEKWSQEACDFVARKLERAGELVLPDEMPSELLRRFVVPEELRVIEGNLLLNEGIQELWDLGIAAGGTTAYNNANADIGVGDSTTAAAATQTDLQAATNKLFKAMVATYPIRTNQTVDFRSDFTSAEANFAWQEWSVRNGTTRNKNLNRKVESLGTKATGTWTLTASLTIS